MNDTLIIIGLGLLLAVFAIFTLFLYLNMVGLINDLTQKVVIRDRLLIHAESEIEQSMGYRDKFEFWYADTKIKNLYGKLQSSRVERKQNDL